jgi:2-hydroxychromene-2-carboxylate isomerase
MAPRVEFHFDFGSPNAYLAHLVIPVIEQRTGPRFAPNPFFPVNTLQIMRGAVAAQRLRCFVRYERDEARHLSQLPH